MEGTPSRWRLPTEQQTPPVEPQTPQDDNVAPRRDQLPSTPLNMFHESSPSAQQQQAASAGTDRSPWRTARVVTELPAIPTRPNQSYGTTGTVSLPRMNINDTNFSRFGNPSQSLLQLSTESHKRRQRGTARGDQYAAEQEAMRRQFAVPASQSRFLRGREGPQAQVQLESEPEGIENPAPPTAQPNVRRNPARNTTRNPTQQTAQQSTQDPQRPRSRERTRRSRRSTVDRFDYAYLSTLTTWQKAKLLGEVSFSLIKGYGPTVMITLVMLLVSCTIIWAGITFFISPLAAYWNPLGSLRSWWNSGNQPGGTIPFDSDGSFSTTIPIYTRPSDDSNIHELTELARRVKDLEFGLEQALKVKADKQDLKMWSDKFQALSVNFEEAKADTDRRLSDIEKLQIGKMLNQIGDRLDKAVKEIAEVKEFQQNTDAALKKLYADLPEMMPVRYGADGKVKVMPEFWSDVTKWFKEQNFSQGSVNEGGADTVIIEKPVKWEEFIAKNGQQLDAHVADLQDKWHKKALREQTLIPKEYHLQMVKELRDEYLKYIEERFHEVHNELGAQLSSLTNLKSMIESGSFGGEGVRKPIGKFLADGLNSHHISKLADYASHAGGAFIDPERTSPTYETHPQGTVVHFLHWALNMPSRIPRPGIVISQIPRTPGNCWPFAGNVGTLGLILREPIYLSSVTVEHMEWETTIEQGATPKTIALWVKPREQEKHYGTLVREAAKALGVSTARVQAPKNFPIMYDYVRIGTFEFDFSETSAPEQTFSVPIDLRRFNISSDRVVFAVQDNYGHPNYTCLYRVKVHGEPVRTISTTKLPVEEKESPPVEENKESPPASDKVEL